MREIEPIENGPLTKCRMQFLFFTEKTTISKFWLLRMPPPRYLSIPLTFLEHNVMGTSEIWLYDPTAIKHL